MAKPTREFSADVGQKSMGVAGPDYIERDFDKLFAMLDPNKNLPTGEQGGIGRENMKPGAVDDTVIGNREIDDTQESTGNVGKLSDLLNWFANMIKSITGKSSWRVKPACTLEQIANSTIDGVKNIGGDIDFVAGTGMEIIPDSQNKKITFAAKNESIIPGPHAETHSSIGSDPITPESIGAETPAGAQAKAEAAAGAVQAELAAHEAEKATQPEGVHGLRVQNGQLEYWDKDDQKWKRIAGGAEVPLGNVKNFTAKAENGQVILTWEDPEDVIVRDVVVSKWAGTKILRKIGSWPENENDGVLVVNNGIRNQYAEDGFVDSGLENDMTYYYMAFPYNTQGLYTVSEENRVSATPRVKIYGLEWNQTLDTYQRLDDAVGMVAITQGQNDFSDAYPWSEMKRCNLADDGTVTAYYGDPMYRDDGSNGQVMVQIPKFWYRSERVIEDGQKKYRWWIANAPVEGFKLHPAFSRNGVEKDYIYIGAYEGYVSDGKLHSRAGVTPTTNRTIAQFRQDAQARGPIWHQQDFLTICAIQLLYLIEYAHFDSQTKIGRGITSKQNGSATGGTAQYGNESYGTTSNGTTPMSYRGIENLYGNVMKWVDGININNHRAYIADHDFQSGKFDGHYRQVGFTNATATGYVKDIGWTELDDFMFLAIDTTGSYSGYLHDYYWQEAGARVAAFGGSWVVSSEATGAFCWALETTSSQSASSFGARLLCVP